MIQQIYITDYLSDAALETAAVIQRLVEQCPILLKADWQVMHATPLNALFNALHATNPTLPGISKVAAVLRARQAWANGLPTLCLLPVHLGLQRDTFSLQGTISILPEVYASLTETLQQHFEQAFTVHPTAEQRFWWIQPLDSLSVQCPWPQDCLYQQAFQWQPQGQHATLVRQWTNESQMLLHQLAQDSLPDWPARLNSLWFASVPDVPVWTHPWQIVSGTGAVFEGLLASQLPAISQRSFTEVLADKAIGKTLIVVDDIDQVDWPAVSNALQKSRLSHLEIVLPFAERSVRMTYKKHYRWQFWRQTPTVQALLDTLEAALPTFKLPEAV